MTTDLDLLAFHLGQLRLQARELDRLDAYFEGKQPLAFLAKLFEAELTDRVTALVLNWPELIVNAYDERSDIEGFRLADSDSTSDEIWDIWQQNNGDELSPQAHIESLIFGRSAVIVGAGETPDDAPVMTVESPKQVGVRRNAKTRLVTSAVKTWQELDDDLKTINWATLYLPNVTKHYRQTTSAWILDDENIHNFGQVPVVPLVNRGRIQKEEGRSEFASITPIADAANKIATDMMTSAEYHAMPRRWAVGVKEDDFVDEDGKPASQWQNIAGHMWASDDPEVKFGQFAESDLTNFHNTIKLLAQVAAQVAYLPQDYMSFVSDNPSSADALRAHEARFVKRCERKHTAWGGSWEDVVRLMLRFENPSRKLDRNTMALETIWRDPATPTMAQKADAVVKLVQQGILTKDFAREELGYTKQQRDRMKQEEEEAQEPLLAMFAEPRATGVSQPTTAPPSQPTAPANAGA